MFDALALFVNGRRPFAGFQHHELCFLIESFAQQKECFAVTFFDRSDVHGIYKHSDMRQYYMV